MTDKKLEIVFAPGAFDNFEGTQEELDELVAGLKQMMEDGTLFENSKEVSLEEAKMVWQRLSNIKDRQ
jgi:hypothetical protein